MHVSGFLSVCAILGILTTTTVDSGMGDKLQNNHSRLICLIISGAYVKLRHATVAYKMFCDASVSEHKAF